MKDYMMLNKDILFTKIDCLLNKEISIICNLTDRNGIIGETVKNVDGNRPLREYNVKTKNNNVKLLDKYLYNLIYDENKKEYILEEHDEYYEKITVDND